MPGPDMSGFEHHLPVLPAAGARVGSAADPLIRTHPSCSWAAASVLEAEFPHHHQEAGPASWEHSPRGAPSMEGHVHSVTHLILSAFQAALNSGVTPAAAAN